jgi:surfeit locus 1 family protein
MLAVTLALGVWQIERLAWKRALLAEIARGEAEPPRPLGDGDQAFRKVELSGRVLPIAAWYGTDTRMTTTGPVSGAYLLVPVERGDGSIVLADLGWSPIDDRPAVLGQAVQLVGYVRPPDGRHWFSVPDDPAKRRFFTLDPGVIGPALGLERVAPFTLVVLGTGQGLPQAATTLPRPPNNHLIYAITWFGLAAVLLVMFTLYARQQVAGTGTTS